VKRALVTGGGGFVGSHIVKQLLARDVECVVVGRNSYPELTALGAVCLQGNICDAPFLAENFRGVDTVFHVAALAGIWGPWKDYYRVNVQGTENVITACRARGVERLIHTSTPSVVFNGEDIVNGNEQLPYADNFLCNYAKSKVLAEKRVLEIHGSHDGPLCCAIRPHLVWGPGDPHLIPRLLEQGRCGKLKRVGNCRNLVDISYVENVAEAHILAAINLENSQTAAGQAYFISQGQAVNLWQWIDELFVMLGVPPVSKRIPEGVAYFVGALLEFCHHALASSKEPRMTRFLAEQLAKSHCFSIDKATRDLGYQPRISTMEGMERLARFYAT
jgi:nucleoside-diphosphate-sugar epimerase